MRYAIGQGRMAVPVCILTLQRNNDDDFDRKRLRKRRDETNRGGFGEPKRPVRLPAQDYGAFRHEAEKDIEAWKRTVGLLSGSGNKRYAVRPAMRVVMWSVHLTKNRQPACAAYRQRAVLIRLLYEGGEAGKGKMVEACLSDKAAK